VTFDAGKSEAAGREGIGRVKAHNPELMVLILILIRELPIGWTGQMEDIRAISEARYYKPTHHNFYGSAAREAIKLGLLLPTGRRVRMKLIDSHGRLTPELYRPHPRAAELV
jgi:hypothetical protein